MRMPMVAGNWKMNGAKNQVEELIKDIISKSSREYSSKFSKTGIASENAIANETNIASIASATAIAIEMVVAPPSIFIQQVGAIINKTNLQLAAQNCHFAASGAFTGEISPGMLQEFGCKYVILGHSERRQLFAETNELIAKKFKAAYAAGVMPILCVGETKGERDSGHTLGVIDQQLDVVIAEIGEMAAQVFAKAVIAYEPVWAIGTGVSATPSIAEEVHAYIRAKLAKLDKLDKQGKHSGAIADKVRILYGGSVTAKNAAELFNQPNIDGGLIGGASLKADEFIAICRCAEVRLK